MMRKIIAKMQRRKDPAFPVGEGVGGKPAKTGGDVAAAAKKRPEEALFAALRQHDYRLRTWSRRPAAKPTPPKEKNGSKITDKKSKAYTLLTSPLMTD